MSATRSRRALPALATRLWESMSSRDDAEFLERARQNWKRLQPAHQMALAQCVADCRRSELARQHRTLIGVAAGLKRRTDATGAELMHNEPCVVFLVRRKVPVEKLERQPRQVLPRYLLAPAWLDGREQPVTVPTDVQPARRVLGAKSQAATAIRTESEDGGGARGSVAWTLQASGTVFALSAIHVLSPAPLPDGLGRRSGLHSQSLSDDGETLLGKPLLRSAPLGGRIAPAPARSFDVQLAEVRDAARLRSLFAPLRLSAKRPWVRDQDELNALLADGRSMEIHVPGNSKRRKNPSLAPLLAVRSISETEFLLDYDFDDGRRQIWQRAIELQVRFGEKTLPGDSGCPVLIPNDDDFPSFVGMHVAGNMSASSSYVIPIWLILSRAAYDQVQGTMPAGLWRLPTIV